MNRKETLQQTIARLAAEAARKPVSRPVVTDEQVAARLEQLHQEHGYIPSGQIVEPIRDFLAGYALLLSGKAGVGKTFLVRSLGVRIYTVDDVLSYGLRRLRTFFDWTDGHNICIDDIGAEGVTHEYGAKDDVIKTVIAHREGRQDGLTHVTTNLDSTAIRERYGDRTLSRLLGMCKPHRMTGENRRRA